MALLRTIVGIFLGASFLIIAAGNLVFAIRWFTLHERSSLVPFLVGLAGALAFLALPIAYLSNKWWLPLMLDIGAVPLVGISIAFSAQRVIREILSGWKPKDL